jgi:hypothetical protein
MSLCNNEISSEEMETFSGHAADDGAGYVVSTISAVCYPEVS